MNGLGRLSGAKGFAEQDDFQNGTGVYIQKFDGPPKVKLADLQKAAGRYKVVKVVAAVTAKAEQKDGKWTAGIYALGNPRDEDLLKVVAELKERKLALVGTVTEDDKQNATLILSKVAEAK